MVNAQQDDPNSGQVYKNPLFFSLEDLPVIVLCDDLRGFLGFIIKTHTTGNYNHAMIIINPTKVVSQGALLQEMDLSGYMKDYEMLKFWRIKNLTPQERQLIYDRISVDLKKPWWGRMYDYVGLIGQALWMPWLQVPWLHYCSEADAAYIEVVPRIAKWMPKEPSPVDLDAIFKKHPEDMENVGYWWSG